MQARSERARNGTTRARKMPLPAACQCVEPLAEFFVSMAALANYFAA